MGITLDYYNTNAESFAKGTMDVDFSATQDKFRSYLEQGAQILDFGCGSGRDTKYFLEKGLEVDATDGSAALCKLASENTGIKVREMLFQDLDEVERYDGIWACASILHLPKSELLPVLEKMVVALKARGVIYTSFKYGEYEGNRNGRYFTDFTLESFESFIADMKCVSIEEHWISGDVRAGREDEKWLNVILRKTLS